MHAHFPNLTFRTHLVNFNISHLLATITLHNMAKMIDIGQNVNNNAYAISLFFFQVDIPNILKQRKQLAKLVLDYDSARAR